MAKPFPGRMLAIRQKPVYIFAEYRIDPLRRRLLRNDEPVTLTAKAFDAADIMETLRSLHRQRASSQPSGRFSYSIDLRAALPE